MARIRAQRIGAMEAVEESVAQLRERAFSLYERSRLPARPPMVQPKVAAAIPCYNEEEFIGDIVLETRKLVDQVIVVNDGSQDATASVARAAGAIVIDHDVNKGYGQAIMTCFDAARALESDILVTLDGDNQHTPEDITTLIGPIVRGEADIVIGSRLLKDSPQTNMQRYRRFGIKAITWLCNVGSPMKVTDSQSGFRAYRTAVLESVTLTDRRMGVSVEMLIKAREKGFIIREMPINCRYHSRSSTQNPLSHGLGVVFAVIMFRLRNLLPSRGSPSRSAVEGDVRNAVPRQSASR